LTHQSVSSRTVRAIDVNHLGRAHVICCWELDGVLVDPGPQSCEETLLAALDHQQPKALLLTHIHFDHAGAAGALVRRWPDLPVYVHERGARHLADPERLVASAARLYGGEEGLARLWGEVVPVPEANLRVLSGGERDVEGAFTVEYTPGHASHHVCYLHEPSGWAFVGDMAGVRVPAFEFTLAPTPPPDIDVEAWERSLETIGGWQPQGLGLTHFGPVEDSLAQLERVRVQLHRQVELAARQDPDAFAAALSEQARAEAGQDGQALIQAAPPDQLYLGLDRWRRKHAEAA
jgi:glyoxylase-like metal-dependent hydrolase (beta-lactamase superfamily II)